MAEKYRVAVLATFRHMLAEAERGTEGRMFGYPSFFINGTMIACVHREGAGFKVPVSLAQSLSRRGDVLAAMNYVGRRAAAPGIKS